MKLITTWHCKEILQGEERETTPREWLILAGPGEDLIFEVKTASRTTNQPNQLATRHWRPQVFGTKRTFQRAKPM